jgi:hypothetical protein
MSNRWPLEGDFPCGGSGLCVTADCLGREFTSRTANHDLTIGLPQLDTVQLALLPPQWTYCPNAESESFDEMRGTFWGLALDARDAAVIERFRFYTSLTVSTGKEFDAAAEDFLDDELGEWWTRFTSWVGILTSQDLADMQGLAGKF